jgi:hypothetical protein
MMISVVIPRASNELFSDCIAVRHSIYMKTAAFRLRTSASTGHRIATYHLLEANPTTTVAIYLHLMTRLWLEFMYSDFTFLRFPPCRAQQALASEFAVLSFLLWFPTTAGHFPSSACLFASFPVFTFITWL